MLVCSLTYRLSLGWSFQEDDGPPVYVFTLPGMTSGPVYLRDSGRRAAGQFSRDGSALRGQKADQHAEGGGCADRGPWIAVHIVVGSPGSSDQRL